MNELLVENKSSLGIDEWQPQTFQELAIYWLVVYAQNRKAPSSIARDKTNLKKYLLPTYGEYRLSDITARNVEFWFMKLVQQSGLAPKSCNDVLILFKKILNDAARWRFVERNPLDFVKKVALAEQDVQFWNKDEVQTFLGYWISKKSKPKALWSILIALYTGMRRGEILGLKWDAVDLNSGFISVRRSYCRVSKKIREETKSKKIRRIPINSMLTSYLTELREMTLSTGLVTPHLHSDSFRKIFMRMARQAGVKPIRFHDLRHTFASHFLMSGGDIYDLRQILGHSTVQVTERYTHVVPNHLQGKTEVLEF